MVGLTSTIAARVASRWEDAIAADQRRLEGLTDELRQAERALYDFADELAVAYRLGADDGLAVRTAGMPHAPGLAEIIDGYYSAPQSRNPLYVRLVARDGEFCQECGATVGLQADHVMPKSLGGADWIANRQLLCRPCNIRKSNKHPDVWRAEVAAKRAVP